MVSDTDITFRRKTPPIALISTAIVAVGVVLFVLNLMLGSVSIPFEAFKKAVFGGEGSTYRAIILDYV